ncbi:MAG: peptidoglycan-associated lipoprotein Pal [Thiogranum sp.]|jgi:peptidoglycan-associated lipoprotein|nr:peptidoglycan-associated lipoprotein Pal [Thiogranum sp.]
MKMFYRVVMVLAVVWLAGCSSTGGTKGGVAVEDHSGTGAEGAAGGATTTGVGAYGDLSIEALNDPNSPLSQRVIYFAFDSSEVAEQDRPLVEAHAAFLVANPTVKVSVEGHTDERGSREYNIGLGDRRAQAVRRMLEFQGVSPSQITVISYGEEKPAVDGHDESAWSMNRRVELVYVGQ